MPRSRRALIVTATGLSLAVTAALAGCAASPAPADGAGTLRVVASTNVYGDIAQTIGGDAVEVTSIIHDASQDPHEYEASPRDALALSEADVVIMNGGGYDDFMTTLLEAHPGDAVVLDAVELSGLEPDDHDHEETGSDAADGGAAEDHDHDHGAFNEHVWYDFDAIAKLATAIADQLGALDPGDAATFTANAAAFSQGLDTLTASAAQLASAHGGERFAITEPVPLYLLELAGLQNATPAEFSEAVEEGTDAPVLVLQEVVALVSDGSVAFLAYNEQTVGPQTQEVLDAAQGAGTPVVSFSELLPDGSDYLGWMGDNLSAVAAALA